MVLLLVQVQEASLVLLILRGDPVDVGHSRRDFNSACPFFLITSPGKCEIGFKGDLVLE